MNIYYETNYVIFRWCSHLVHITSISLQSYMKIAANVPVIMSTLEMYHEIQSDCQVTHIPRVLNANVARCCLRVSYFEKFKWSRIELTRSLELQIVGGTFGHLCPSVMGQLVAAPFCWWAMCNLRAVLYSLFAQWIRWRSVLQMHLRSPGSNEIPAQWLDCCLRSVDIGT